MKTIAQASREVPVLSEVDVLVIGGGAAGVGAAMAAGRCGAKTVLVEKYNCLGGCQTLTFNDSFSFVDDRIQGGIIKEVMDDLFKANVVYESCEGGYISHWSTNEACYYFDGEYYKYMLDQKMMDAEVQILYHAFAVDGIREGRELKGVIIESWNGRQAILANTVIDCTGIADISWKSGASCYGEEGYPDDRFGDFAGQHMGFGYGYFFRNMDYPKFRKFAEENPEEWNDWVKGRKMMVEAKADGRLYSFRDTIVMQEYKDGRAWIISPGYPLKPGRHPWQLEEISDATVDMRKQAWSIYELLRENVPGFENAKIEQTPAKLLFRDGHRIIGDYTLSEDDMYNGHTYEDSITCSNMAPDPFFPTGGHHFKYNVLPYDIPYRCLLSKDFDNLMAAGGNSSTDMIVFAANRYCVPAMCTGQAAGTAAAMAAKKGTNVRGIEVSELQDELHKQGLVTTNKNLPPEVVEEYRRRDKEWGDGFGM